MSEKLCTSCNNIKGLHLFYRSPSTSDGLEWRCKECKSAYIKSKWATSPEYRSAQSSRSKPKCQPIARSHNCNSCNAKFHTTTSPNTTGCCRACSKQLNDAKWTNSHLGVKASSRAKRRASELKATPRWLTDKQLEQISLYYKVARWVESILGEPIEVDHIVPIQGKNVTGLHVPWNLQLLTKSENIKKSNKLYDAGQA